MEPMHSGTPHHPVPTRQEVKQVPGFSALSRDSLPAGLADRRTQRLVATGTGCHRDKAQQ